MTFERSVVGQKVQRNCGTEGAALYRPRRFQRRLTIQEKSFSDYQSVAELVPKAKQADHLFKFSRQKDVGADFLQTLADRGQEEMKRR